MHVSPHFTLAHRWSLEFKDGESPWMTWLQRILNIFLAGVPIILSFWHFILNAGFWEIVRFYKNASQALLPNYKPYKQLEQFMNATFVRLSLWTDSERKHYNTPFWNKSAVFMPVQVILVSNMITRADKWLNKYSCIQICSRVYSQRAFIRILIRRYNLTSSKQSSRCRRVWCQLHSPGNSCPFLSQQIY